MRDAVVFYSHSYREGFTTELPDEHQLRALLSGGFRGHEKDFTPYIDVVRATGVEPPARSLDFGASWAYGSWQFQNIGYRVSGYAIGLIRARFAGERLGIDMILSIDTVSARIDCFFSAHVLEYLADPDQLWEAAKSVLAPDGVVAVFVPNGHPELEGEYDRERYHALWGQAHPLLITPDYLAMTASRHGFACRLYSSPYRLDGIRRREPGGNVLGQELLVLARRQSDER
jgi:SAM-dependent methyltransferase